MNLYILFVSLIAFAKSILVINSSVVSPLYAESLNTNYDFKFVTQNNNLTIQNNSYFIVQFPSPIYLVTSVQNCYCLFNGVNITSTVNCTVTTNNYINVTNIVQSDTDLASFQITFVTSGALYASTPFLQFYFADSTGNIIGDSSVTTSLTIYASTMNCALTSNNSVVGATSVYTVIITPVMPIYTTQLLSITLPTWGPSNSSNFVGSASCSSSCTSNILSGYQYVTIPSLVSANTSNSQTILLKSIKNPSSTAPISIALAIKTSTFFSIQNCSLSFGVTTPNTFKASSFIISNTSILAVNTVPLSLVINNPIPANISYLRITTTLPISYNYTSLNSNMPVLTPTTDGSILLGNLSTSNINSGIAYTIGNFIITNPPSTKSVALTVTSQFVSNKVFYKMDSTTISITATVSTIQVATVKIVSSSGANLLGIYNISFNIINPLTNNSFIIITFPTETKVSNISTCTSSYGNCNTINTTNQINLTLTSSYPANTNITVVANSIMNPFYTLKSSTFQIYTYYEDINSLVDQLTSGLTVLSTPNPIISATLTSSNYTVQSISSYTFTVNFTNTITPGTTFIITFPAEITLNASIKFNSTNNLNCTIQQSGQTITLSSCSSNNISPNIKFILDSITNPSSMKTTSTFNITSYYNGSLLEYLSSSLTITMNNALQFSYLSVVSDNQTITANATYTFVVVFSTMHYSGDKLMISLPSQISFSNLKCSVLYGLSSLQCIGSNQIINLTLFFSTFPINYTISFTLSSMKNDWLSKSYTLTINSLTNDTTPYYIQNGITSISFIGGFMGVIINSNNYIVLLSKSTLQITLYSPTNSINTYGGMFSLMLLLPASDFTVLNGCAPSSGVCVYDPSLNGYNVTSISDFQTSFFLSINVTTNYFLTTSSTLKMVLSYTIGNSSYFLASNNVSVVIPFCTNPCASCGSIPTQCLSCLTISYTTNISYYSNNYTCLQSCPNQYYSNGSVCLSCTDGCTTCTVTSSNCTSCTNSYLYNNTCGNTCPKYYYANSANWSCTQCGSVCLECTSATVCVNCNSNYYFYQSTCVTNCPNLFIPYQGNCTICSSVCLSCYSSLDNCTSCNSPLILYNNTCISVCPSNYFTINSSCVLCSSICLTCSSATVCLTCNQNQSLFSGTCITDCPAGYISIAFVCNACSSQCLTCTNLVNNCSTCSSNYYSYGTACLSTCPIGLHPYNQKCVNCISPCVSCQSLATNCTSCISQLYLFNNTCNNKCPQSYYIDYGTQSCLSCGNCLICQSLTNCTSCNPGSYLVSNLCYTSCPTEFPIISGQKCLACDSMCLTCSISTYNCTSCFTNTYQFRYTCVSTCPLGLYTNKLTGTCESGLLSKIIFFPFLITGCFIIILVFFSKCYEKKTSIFTCFVSGFALIQLGLYIFYTAELNMDSEIKVAAPLALSCIGILSLVILSVIFYIYNLKKIKLDESYNEWINTKNHYETYMIISWISILNFKFYRLLYSRVFRINSLSMVLKSQASIFPHTTIFTILSGVLSSLLIVISSVIVIYQKNLKDQIFYTAVECLIVTIISLSFTLLDIYKEENYFENSDFSNTKKFLTDIKEKRYKETEEIQGSQPPSLAVESQKGFVTAGQSFYKKKNNQTLYLLEQSSGNIKQKDEESENQSYQKFQEIKKQEVRKQEGGKQQEVEKYDVGKQEIEKQIVEEQRVQSEQHSLKTLELQSGNKKPQQIESQPEIHQEEFQKKKKKRINIFKTIQQDQAQYQLNESIDSNQEAINQMRREIQSQQKINKQQQEDIQQTQSMLDHRQLKNKWNKIVKYRKSQAKKLLTKESHLNLNLNNNIKQQNQNQYSKAYNEGQQELDFVLKKRKKIKVTKDMRKIQYIYMQRLNVIQQERPKKISNRRKRKNTKPKDKFQYE